MLILRTLRKFLASPEWLGIGVMVGTLAIVLQAAQVFGERAPEEESADSSLSSEQMDPEALETTTPPQNEGGQTATASGVPLSNLDTEPLSEPKPVSFTVDSKLIRCPSGGDWLGRERNRRSGYVQFRAPTGTWITSADARKLSRSPYGKQGIPEYYETVVVDEKIRNLAVRARIWCDPPNYPGAPGSWVKVQLSGKHSPVLVPSR